MSDRKPALTWILTKEDEWKPVWVAKILARSLFVRRTTWGSWDADGVGDEFRDVEVAKLAAEDYAATVAEDALRALGRSYLHKREIVTELPPTGVKLLWWVREGDIDMMEGVRFSDGAFDFVQTTDGNGDTFDYPIRELTHWAYPPAGPEVSK